MPALRPGAPELFQQRVAGLVIQHDVTLTRPRFFPGPVLRQMSKVHVVAPAELLLNHLADPAQGRVISRRVGRQRAALQLP